MRIFRAALDAPETGIFLMVSWSQNRSLKVTNFFCSQQKLNVELLLLFQGVSKKPGRVLRSLDQVSKRDNKVWESCKVINECWTNKIS